MVTANETGLCWFMPVPPEVNKALWKSKWRQLAALPRTQRGGYESSIDCLATSKIVSIWALVGCAAIEPDIICPVTNNCFAAVSIW
jgi:hypothetical protein